MEFRTELGITTEMVEDAIQRGLINPSSDVLDKLQNGENTENQYILDLSTHGYQLSTMERILEAIYLNIDLDTATGEGLDKFGDMLNVHRIQPVASFVEVSLTLLTAADTDIIIPAGTPCRIVEIRENGSQYITADEVVIGAGVTTGTVICESVVQDYLPILPAGAVEGLEGFNDFVVTNPAPSTSGRRIESDEDYRLRIKEWITRNERGSKDCIRNYLDHFEGLDSYYVIPRYDGIGTLKVVCDTLASNLPLISEGLYNNAMNESDDLPYCVLPTGRDLQTLTITIEKADMVSNLSDDELIQLLIAQTRTYVEGGITRQGFRNNGLGIGGDLHPSKLIAYLSDGFPECANIKLSITDTVEVDPLERLHLTEINVVFAE